MAVACPGCGREYDPARFRSGRTLRCACGARVGRRAEPPAVANRDEQRFLADAMLGRLARWLRTIGYDTAYDAGLDDAALVRRALDEGRILLTRDRSLPEEWWIASCLLVEGEEPLEQLREVVERFQLDWRRRLFSRCSRCNRPLEPAGRTDLGKRVPARVLEEHRRFERCPACGRVYWQGSHARRMWLSLERALGSWG